MDDLIAFLDYRTDIWGLIFPETVLYLTALILVVLILWGTYRAFRPPKQLIDVQIDHRLEYSTCANCGWVGELSKLHRVCPKCGQSNFVE